MSSQKSVTLAGDELEKVEKFCYLGDVLSTEEVQGAVVSRLRAVWKKFKKVTKVLYMKVLSIKLRGGVYKMCEK